MGPVSDSCVPGSMGCCQQNPLKCPTRILGKSRGGGDHQSQQTSTPGCQASPSQSRDRFTEGADLFLQMENA